MAIVIQGPVKTIDEFTFETIKLYKQNFPEAIIILSTWNDESKIVLSRIENLGVVVLKNKKPKYAGISHVNYQIASSKQGMKKAKELGAEYAIKTRTDQRMYATNIEEYLFNMLNLFPLDKSIKKQQKRIIGVSLNTFKYRMYGLSDMFTYGCIDDMMLFWGTEHDTRFIEKKDKVKARLSLRNFSQMRICEVYLTTEFLKNINRSINWTLEDSWRVLSDHFCIIDKDSLDLFWDKYTLSEDRWKDYSDEVNIYEEFNFKDWLNIYNMKSGYTYPELILDKPLRS